jgi:hypothetical protein
MVIIFVENQRHDIPISQITMIRWNDHDPWLVLANGDSYRITHEDLDQIQRKMTVAHYPALPETFYLTHFQDEQSAEIFRTPVLGWKIDGAGRTRPVVMKFGEYDCDNFAIRFPNGTVEDADGGFWATEESWLAGLRA